MKVKTLSMLAGGASLLLAGTASADFMGIEIRDFTDFFMTSHPSASVRAAYQNAGLNTYRIYATFSSVAVVEAHGGKDSVGAHAWMNSTDGAFWNLIEEGYHGTAHYNFAPNAGNITANASHAFDTFGTIGNFVSSAAGGYPDDSLVGGGNNFTANWVMEDEGFFVTPTVQVQGQASQNIQGVEADGTYRVLLYQVSVAEGTLIEGNIGVLGGFFGPAGSGGETYEIVGGSVGDVLYFGFIPAPGALALLGLAGFVGTRRRRA